MSQSCKTCARYPGCLFHSAVIYGYFIMTGRDNEIPEDTSDINASGACGGRYEADSTKVSIERIKNSTKPIHYTYGFQWKGAETKVVSKEAAIKAILDGHWAHYDLTDEKDCLHLNLFSANDMF